jgi:hypothetical protein
MSATELWEWIDADGVAHPFTDVASGIVAGQGSNFWMPDTRRQAVSIPGRMGQYVLDSSYRERLGALQVTLDTRKLYAHAVDTNVEGLIAAVATMFNVLRGPGQLRHTRLDGTRRVLYCEYDSGFGLQQANGLWRQGVQQAVLQFFAGDPVWYDDADTTTVFTTALGGSFFPIPNVTTLSFVTITASEVFGTVSVVNSGDVPIYPVWTITGPASSIVLRNVTTGEVIDLTGNGGLTLTAGQVLTVDTRVGTSKLQLADGTNKAGFLTDASVLWSIGRGTSSLRVEMSGSTVASAAQLAYRKGFLVP